MSNPYDHGTSTLLLIKQIFDQKNHIGKHPESGHSKFWFRITPESGGQRSEQCTWLKRFHLPCCELRGKCPNKELFLARRLRISPYSA